MKATRLLSWLLVVCMVLGMVPVMALTASAAGTYTKVTSAPSDWSGTYLIVNEDNAVALNGALPDSAQSLDSANNNIAVTITDGTIAGSDTIDAATVTIAAVDGGYTIKTASGYYIGQTSDANDLLEDMSTAYVNTLSMNDDGTVNIVSGGAYLRYNSASNSARFRYYKSTTYTSQKAITLYLLEGSSGGSTGGDNGDTGDTDSTVTPNGADVYVRVESASDLVAGDVYVIAAASADYSYAMSTEQKTNNRGQAEVTKLDNLLFFSTEVQEFVLGSGTASDTYSFKLSDGSGYIYAASGSNNYLRTESTLSANSSWTISIADGVATVTAQGANTRNLLQYNSGSSLFSCYASAQKDIAIYRKVYSLVTDPGQLTVGDQIVIAAAGYDYAIGQTQNSNNRAQAEVAKTPAEGAYALSFASSAAVAEFVLGEGTTSGTYSFYDPKNSGYIYAASGSNNYLRTESTLSANSSWTISVADGVATVTAQGANTRNLLQYNSGSSLFSCYASAQKDIAIYRKTAVATYYTASLYVGGGLSNTINTTGALELPTEAAVGSWSFEGWVTDETDDLISGTTTAPTLLSGSVTISANTDYYAVYSYDGTYSTRPVSEEESSVEASMKIITGEGEAYFLYDGMQYGLAATEKGIEVRNEVTAGIELKLVIKPANGYRIACIEKQANRLDATAYTYDADLGAYVYTFTVSSVTAQNYFRISFLPRISDGGYTATQITGWNTTDASGIYVITGLSGDEDYTNNAHSVASTYLLYGDDDTAVDDNYAAIGRKSSALQLGAIGVSLLPVDPYLMSGLNENHLMAFELDAATGYYTIRLYGAKETNRYIAASGSGAYIKTVDALTLEDGSANNYAYWDITYVDGGAVQIKNVGWDLAGTAKYLMFNKAGANLQFRVYSLDSTTASLPILYGASHSNYHVTYSVTTTGTGSISATNNTTGGKLSAETYQPADSSITFTFTPAVGYQLSGVTLNGTDITVTEGEDGAYTYTYSSLDQDLNIVATFTVIPPASFTVEYYLNEELKLTVPVSAKSPYVINSDLDVTYEGNTYKFSDFAFDAIVNGSDTYADMNAAVTVKESDVVKIYFSTTEVSRTKTATEITVMDAETAALGGENFGEGDEYFSDANEQDVYNNVKQAYRVELSVKSNDMIEEVKKGGNTDVILVLDHSNSMYPPYSNNADYIETAVKQFANIVFADNNAGDNRIALVQYDTEARAWSGSKLVSFQWDASTANGEKELERDVADYGLTYSGCFMDTTAEVTTALAAAMYEPDTDITSGGMTNTMGGFFMTDIVARTRSTSTDRDLVIIMFTDGLPTCRYLTATTYITYDNSGTRTSAWEFRRAMEEAQNLRTSLNKYKKCTSTIYNIALLNDSDITTNDKKIIRALLSANATYQWTYDTVYNSSKYTDLRSYISSISTYFTKIDPYADYYKEITGTIDANVLADLYEDIAYEFVAAKYVTGTITDIVPADFELTAASEASLKASGYTVVHNSDGTTTISKDNVRADETGETVTYDIIYQGSGYGSVYTNEQATFEYTNLQTEQTHTGLFPKPTVTVIPWTVNDRHVAQLNTATTINILGNDLFKELIEGGYTLSDFTITLTDENGNPMVYNDAIEQVSYGFDAVIDPLSNTITFYTEQGGTSTFYYVVSATATAPDGTATVVSSRATQVDVLVAELDKYAREVTDRDDLPEGVERTVDEHGNVDQMYLVTLMINKFDIQNGVITDTIPEDFEFIAFAETPSASCTISDNVITCSGITCGSTIREIVLSYYIRYIGGGYGVRPTNVSATFSYDTTSSATTVTESFPIPTAGLNPYTVNDIDIAKTETEYTLDILENDLFQELGSYAGGYKVSDLEVILTDENGTPLTSEQIADLGIKLTINEDGSVTYTADEPGLTQFYYVVTSQVSLPGGSTYAIDNSQTLISRPTMVTIYAMEDVLILIDFGLTTLPVDYIHISDTAIAEDVSLKDQLEMAAFVDSPYGELIVGETTGRLSFRPITTKFDGSAVYDTPVTMKASVYNNNTPKTIDVCFKVIPANNIYFEESFLDFSSAWENLISTESDSSSLQDAGETHNVQLHGYDEAYQNSNQYSEGVQKAVTVNMDNIEEEAWFTFSGTGFDLIGSTNSNSGVVVAQVYEYDASAANGCGTLIKNILVDTYLQGGKNYDQLPIIMFRNTDADGNEVYGTYRVKIRAFYNAIFDHNYVTPAKTVAGGSYVIAAKVGEAYYAMAADGTGTLIEVQANGTVTAQAAGSNAKTVTYKPNGYIITDLTYTAEDNTTGSYWLIGGSEDAYTLTGARNSSAVLGYDESANAFAVGNAQTELCLLPVESAEENSSRAAARTALSFEEDDVREVLGLSEDAPLEIQRITAEGAATRSLNATKNGQYSAYIDGIRIYNPLEIYAADDSDGSDSETTDPEEPTEPEETTTEATEPEEPTGPEVGLTIIESGDYVIAANVAGSYYALPMFVASRISGTAIDAPVDGATTDSTYAVTITYTASGYTLLKGTKYLGHGGGTSTSFTAGTDPFYWSITEGVNGTYRITPADNEARGLVFRAGTTNAFGAYATSNISETSTEYYDIELIFVEPSRTTRSTTDATTLTDEEILYAAAGELCPTFSNINDHLLGADSWTTDSSIANGMLYIADDNTVTNSGGVQYNTGVYLSSSGLMYTKQTGDNLYLYASSGRPVMLTVDNVTYTVYVKPISGTESTNVSNEVEFFYFDGEQEIKLTNSQINSLDITYYDDKYESIGPENEVYLQNNQGIAFAIDLNTTVQISAKIPTGDGFVLLQIWDSTAKVWRDVANVTSRTEMYYKIDTNYAADGVVILKCNIADNVSTDENDITDTVLSLCNIKIASSSPVSNGGILPLTARQAVKAINVFKVNPTMHINHEWNDWTIASEPTCTESGLTTGVCACGAVEESEVAALGHSYDAVVTEATYTDSGYITFTCAICSDSYSVLIENAESEYVLDEDLSFIMSISASADMQVRYTVLSSKVSRYESLYLEVSKAVAGGEAEVTTYELADMEAILNNYGATVGYQATYANINAKEMGDEFTAVLYAVAEDGTVYRGKESVSSMKSYLIGKLDAASSGDELKTMCVDMLNYGAAAQLRLGYDTENPVNADLTDAQKAYASAQIPEAVNDIRVNGEGSEILSSVSVQSTVILYLNTKYETSDSTNLRYVIHDAEGELVTMVPIYNNNGFWCGSFDQVSAKQMRELLTITLYDGDTAVSQSLTWSIESYVASVRENSSVEAEINMVNAMLAYGDSVAAYMAASGQ